MQWKKYVPPVMAPLVEASLKGKKIESIRRKVSNVTQTFNKILRKGVRVAVRERDLGDRIAVLEVLNKWLGASGASDVFALDVGSRRSFLQRPEWLYEMEVDVLSQLWLPDTQRVAMEKAHAHFFSMPTSGPSAYPEGTSHTQSGWEDLVDYSPAKNREEARVLTSSGKYRWVYKSAHDNSEISGEGFKLRPVEKGKLKPWIIPDPMSCQEQDTVLVAETPNVAPARSSDLLDPNDLSQRVKMVKLTES